MSSIMEHQSPSTSGLQEVSMMTALHPLQPSMDHIGPIAEDQNHIDIQQGHDITEETIAERTRSRVPLIDFEPDDRLDFPDVDTGLYQSADSEGDTPYREFLLHLYDGTDPNMDDHDPDYRVNDDFFSYGWRFDVEEELEDQRIPGFKSPETHERCKIDIFEKSHFKRILDQQLRQHIQLLMQTYLLTSNTKVIHEEAIQVRGYLEAYLKVFKNKSKPSNLLPAIELMNSTVSDVKYPYIRLSWRPLPIPDDIRTLLDMRRDIFMYENLLPEVSFSKMFQKMVKNKDNSNTGRQMKKKINSISSQNDDESANTKAIFTPNEDKLLALALKEFQGETSQYACISKLLMAAKTKMQINNRIKNIKRSPGNEDHPVKAFYANGNIPEIDLDADAKLRPQITEQKPSSPSPETTIEDFTAHQDCEDIMNMDLDDLMAASTTISKAANQTNYTSNNVNSSNISEKNLKNQKLRNSMIELMSNHFSMTREMGDLIVEEFISSAKTKLGERNHIHLLQLLAELMRKESRNPDSGITIYNEISKFLYKIEAPREFQERLVLFLDLEQATKIGCAASHLHWMRFFEFLHHAQLHHEGEAIEKKLTRLIDALQKDDPHKVKLAAANLITYK